MSAMRPSRIRARRAAGEQAAGIAIFNSSPETVEIAGVAGADFVFIDAEHGTLGLRDIYDMVRAADVHGMDSLVRVPNDEPTFIARLLDGGATGIVVPHVRSAEQLERIVASTQYGENGLRGACPNTRAFGYQSLDWEVEAPTSNERVIIWAIIEDYIALDEIDRLAQVKGVDSLSLGMFDLMQGRGLKPGDRSSELDDLVATFHRAVEKYDIDTVGVIDPAVEMEAPMNAPLVLSGSDRGVLADGFRRAIRSIRPDNSNDSAERVS